MPANARPLEYICPTCKCSASQGCWDLIRNDAYPDGIFHKARIDRARAETANAEENANRPRWESRRFALDTLQREPWAPPERWGDKR